MQQTGATITIAGSTVTAIDYGTYQPSGQVITMNTSTVFPVRPATIRRQSKIYSKPTQIGHFHQPLNWGPDSEIREVWGVLQYIIDDVDVTYFRDIPAELGGWIKTEPNGDTSSTIKFSQIYGGEPLGQGDLTWAVEGKDVTILRHAPDGSIHVKFEGLLVGRSISGKGMGVGFDTLGVLYQADHTPYIQELYLSHRNGGVAIADIMDGTISRHFGLCNRPVMEGIETNIRGSGGPRLTQAVQDILSTAYTPDGTNQWTISNLPGRKPFIHLKDRTTRHWSFWFGSDAIDLSLSEDWQQLSGMVWGSGIAPDGGSWFNAKYPGIHTDTAPAYPLGVGAVFYPGASTTGFRAFSEEMRLRGYPMSSTDTYKSSDESLIRGFQFRAGITVDSNVGAQTWDAMFGVGGEDPSLTGAHISPLAIVPWNLEFFERADGTQLGANPAYDRSRLAIGRLIAYGEGYTKAQGTQFAQQEIAPRLAGDALWIGSATISGDPAEGSRFDIEAGHNIFIHNLPNPPTHPDDDGIQFHISQSTTPPGDGDVSVQLSYLAHDMTTLAAIAKRNKDTLDPARRGIQSRSSRIVQDNIVPWDAEAGGGKISVHNLQGGFWTVIRIAAGQIGRIVETRYVCGSGVDYDTLAGAFNTSDNVPGAHKFWVAAFAQRITSNYMKGVIGNPAAGGNKWTANAVSLESNGLIQAYGTDTQAAGFWPGQESAGGTITGKLRDTSAWDWTSTEVPYLWLAEYCVQSTKIAGLLRNAPLGSV